MEKPAVIVISSHVARGTVGNRAAVFALETLGFPVWAVPTVILPWHPGHGPATRIVPDARQFSDVLDDLATAPWLGEVGAVLSGYIGEPSQADAVAALVAAVKRRRPEALYVCDPVSGDGDGLYVPQATAEALRDRLLPLADVATPNLFELAWLAARDLPDREAVLDAARTAGPATVLATSLPGFGQGRTGNLLVTPQRALLAEHARIHNPPHGLGDLTAALLLAHLLSGDTDEEALHATTASVLEVLANATRRGADELMLETDVASLSRPTAKVDISRFDRPARSRSA